jgi:hypothetical protein
MKENKFLFYGCVIATIVCATWSHFCMPIDIEISYDVEPVETEDSGDDFFVDISENVAEKPQYEISYRCEAPRPVHHTIYEYGNIIADEYDTYNSQCMCMVSVGNQKPVWFDLKYVDSRMFESKTAKETTDLCNDKCQTVCETGFEMFLNDNPNFKPFADGEFVGCSSQFELQSWAQEVNGQSTERYYSTNTISCQCAYGDDIIEKTEMYQYFSEPNKKELDCNKKCAEICAE